jgi:hypothetical protein
MDIVVIDIFGTKNERRTLVVDGSVLMVCVAIVKRKKKFWQIREQWQKCGETW